MGSQYISTPGYGKRHAGKGPRTKQKARALRERMDRERGIKPLPKRHREDRVAKSF